MTDKKVANTMQCTKDRDVLLCRDVLALEPYKYKKGSNEAGRIWTDIAQSLKNCQQITFKPNLSQRSVRERFALLQAKYKQKNRDEMRASGISPDQDELDQLLEDITEREQAAEEDKEDTQQKKQQEKAAAENIRKQAMERMGQTNKRTVKEQGTKEKRRRRSGNEAFEFVRDKSEIEITMREKELELHRKEQQEKAKEFDAMARQHQALMEAMQQQQAQQQLQSQNMQMMMAQQNQAIMALLDKIVSKQ